MRHLHVAENHGDPGISGGMVRLEQVMRGIKSTQARGGTKGAHWTSYASSKQCGRRASPIEIESCSGRQQPSVSLPSCEQEK